MKKTLLILLLFAVSAFATTKTWTAADSANDVHWDNDLNWSPNGMPGTNDTAIFDASGGSKAPLTTAAGAPNPISIGYLKVAAAYTRALSFSGKILVLNNGGANDSGITGTHILPDSLALVSNGALKFSAGIAAPTASSCKIYFHATDTITDNKNSGFKNIRVHSKLLINGSAAFTLADKYPVTMDDNAILTINSTTSFNCNATGGAWFTLGSNDSIRGSSNISLYLGNNGTVTMPA